ncbi:MAG: hypothetical protein PW789_00495 [Edaphobacter sp.]|uniref:hypothetical protein n=1 Tax=Edaphobacter sp. TaxID=1934404 RepID=UPI00239CAA4E|nr:hypothetical protein [Edaphobacter sp.]MDE1175068.1 hypothetical protein [Edaphobacter sp.]
MKPGIHPHRVYDLAGEAQKSRLMDLEIENARLQRLVAELLLKNQELRREHKLDTAVV